MTDTYKATPEQWAEVGAFASATRDCILELRARVEALEAQDNHSPGATKMVWVAKAHDTATPPTVATDEELLKIWNFEKGCRPWVSRRAIYNLGIKHGQASSPEVAEPAPVAGGLVERVKRADILEVATWLREHGWENAANLLEEEAGR